MINNSIKVFPKIARDRMFRSNQLIDHGSPQSGHIPAILLVITVILYFLYLLAMQPGWVLSGEMWAEMATNYFPNANSPSYFQKFFAADAGYIPVPQRLIALAGNLFNLPASSIPYFYTWSAILLTGLMIGAFCLAQFRILVKSDALRFLTAIAILVVADFETRTFINFTYFAAFFVAIITALALVDDTEELPWWAWFVPILMVSKPAVLAALPAMILAAMVSKSRFRWITVATVALCIGQIAQMVFSQKAGVFAPANEISFWSKIITTFKYFFGFFGGYIFGQNFQLSKYFSMLAGLFILIVSGLVIFKKRNNAGSLVFVGISLLFFNFLLNSFALSATWNEDMARLAGLPLYRHMIVGFLGCVLVVAGLFASLTDETFSKSKSFAAHNIGALFFIAWFVGSGWFSFGGRINREPMSPTINNSQWQNMAFAIDSAVSPLCVPIDPLGWMYSRNCAPLNLELITLASMYGWRFEAVRSIDDLNIFEVTPPTDMLADKTLISLAVLVRPFSPQTTFVNVNAIINLKDGDRRYYKGGRNLAISGGLILLTGKDSFPIKKISSVRFIFSSPVEIALTAHDSKGVPAILWMGN